MWLLDKLISREESFWLNFFHCITKSWKQTAIFIFVLLQSTASNSSSPPPTGSEVSNAPEGDGGSRKGNQRERAEVSATPHTSSSPLEPGTEVVKQEREGAVSGHEEPLQDQNTPVIESSGGNVFFVI